MTNERPRAAGGEVSKSMVVYALPADVVVEGAPEYFLPVPPTSSDPQALLRLRAIARQLGVGTGEVKELIEAGLIRATRDDDDEIVIRQRELDKFIGQLRKVELVEKEVEPAAPAEPDRKHNPAPAAHEQDGHPASRARKDDPEGYYIPGVTDAGDDEMVPLLLVPGRLVGRMMEFFSGRGAAPDAGHEPDEHRPAKSAARPHDKARD